MTEELQEKPCKSTRFRLGWEEALNPSSSQHSSLVGLGRLLFSSHTPRAAHAHPVCTGGIFLSDFSRKRGICNQPNFLLPVPVHGHPLMKCDSMDFCQLNSMELWD